MKYKAPQEPKPFKAFRDKYLAAPMMAAALLISFVTSAQTDSAKYSPINGYGFKYKRVAWDSVMMVPLSTSPHVPYRKGGIRYNTGDSTLQLWTGNQWLSIVTGVGNGVDTAYMYNDTVLTIETPNEDFFIPVSKRHVDSIYRKNGQDSIYFKILGIERAIKDSSGGSSTTLSNVGPGFRLATTPNGSVKSLVFGYGVNGDSTTNANAITVVADTSELVTPSDLNDAIATARGDTISHKDVAYVETTGSDATGRLNNPARPFATLNGALDALPSTGGKIKIGVGEFLAPDTAKIKSNIWFAGSGMPVFNDTTTVSGVLNTTTTAVTKMLGGTIIHNMFLIPFNRNNVHVTDLGVDNGKEWCDSNNGGTPMECLLFAQKFGAGLNSADGFHLLQTSSKPRTGVLVRNVSCLAYSATASVHCMIFENMTNPHVENVYTCYGFAGVVIKSMGGVYSGIHARGHSDAGIYLKSNDYSYCYGVVLDGFEISSVGTNDGGGLHLNANDAGSPGMYLNVIANGSILGTKYGVKSNGTLIDNMSIMNVSAANIQGHGFDLSIVYSLISNCSARTCGLDGFHISGSTAGNGPFISNCFSASNTGDGFELSGGSLAIHLDNTISEYNGGYGVNTSNSNTRAGVHYEANNGSGATNGTLLSKISIVDPISIYANSSQYMMGPSASNKSSLFSNSLAAYLMRNGTFNGTSFVPSDLTKESEMLELGGGGLQFYNNTAGVTPMVPTIRFKVDGTGKAYIMNADSLSSAPNMVSINPNTRELQLSAVPSGGDGIYGGNGSLPSDVTVSTAGNTLTVSGSNDNETSFNVTNTGTTSASAIAGTASGTTSIGVTGTSSSYIGVFGNSTTSNGIQGQSSSGVGVVGVSSTGSAFRGQINPSSNNAVENIVTLLRTSSSGAGANGIGAAIQYELETATNGNSQTAGSLVFQWTDATSATRTSAFEIYGVNSGTTARKAALAGSGQWTWDTYGQGTHSVTPATTPVYSSTGVVGERIAPKIYTALLTQSGTGAPTATILGTNEIGSIVWTRNSTGNYTGTLTGAFTVNKTWAICQKGDMTGSFANGLLSSNSANSVLLTVTDNAGSSVDNFTNMSIEIRVYP